MNLNYKKPPEKVRKAYIGLDVESKLRLLKSLNVIFPKEVNSYLNSINSIYEPRSSYMDFMIDFNPEVVRVYQTDRIKHEIQVQHIWGAPVRGCVIAALHEALNLCLDDHLGLLSEHIKLTPKLIRDYLKA